MGLCGCFNLSYMKEKARKLYDSGLSTRKVAEELGVSASTVRKLLLDTGGLRSKKPKQPREIIGEELLCLICNEMLDASFFSFRKDRQAYNSYCRDCYNKRYNQTEKRRKKQGQRKYPVPCPSCLFHRRIDVNGDCWKCNLERGLKQCSKCGELLPLFLSFSRKGRTCDSCFKSGRHKS